MQRAAQSEHAARAAARSARARALRARRCRARRPRRARPRAPAVATTTASASSARSRPRSRACTRSPPAARALDPGRLDTGQDRQARGRGVDDLRERRAREPQQRLRVGVDSGAGRGRGWCRASLRAARPGEPSSARRRSLRSRAAPKSWRLRSSSGAARSGASGSSCARVAREQPRQAHQPRRLQTAHPGNRRDTEETARIDRAHATPEDLRGDGGPQREQLVAQAELVHPREQLAVGAREQRAGGLEAEALDRVAGRAAPGARLALEHAHVEAQARQAPGRAEAGEPRADHHDPARAPLPC